MRDLTIFCKAKVKRVRKKFPPYAHAANTDHQPCFNLLIIFTKPYLMSWAFDVLSEHRPNLIANWEQKTISSLARFLVEASCLEPNIVLPEFTMFVIPKKSFAFCMARLKASYT